jgi:hypothetical protein
MQRLAAVLRVRSFAQVIIEPLPRGFRLTAQLLHANELGAPVHLTATAPTLRAAAIGIARELIAEWDGGSDTPNSADR